MAVLQQKGLSDRVAVLEQLSLNFVGPIEPFEAFHGAADVVVCDGFVGNVMLKTVEATVDLLLPEEEPTVVGQRLTCGLDMFFGLVFLVLLN